MKVNIFSFFRYPEAIIPFFKGGDSKRWSGFYIYGSGGVAFGSDWTISGSAAASPDDFTNWRRHSCTTTPGGYRTNAIDWMRRAWRPKLWIRLKTDAVISNMRLWTGLWSTTALNSEDPSGAHLAAFRYHLAYSDKLYFCTKDGTTLNQINTNILVTENTVYDLEIDIPGDGYIYWKVSTPGGASASGSTNLNLPGLSQMLGGGFMAWATTGTVYYKSVYAHCEHN